ncbi:MAG: NADH-quinone oxidoreductase subunit, partial [Actinomycetota bacterium]
MNTPVSLFAADAVAASDLPTGWFLENAWLIPIVPAVAFFLIIFLGKRMPRGGSEFGIASMVVSLFLSAMAAWQWIDRVGSVEEGTWVGPVVRTWTWWQNAGVPLGIGLHVDGLTVTILVVVAFISTLVQIYSLEYLRGDRRYTHFFASLTLFSAGMLNMVVAENMIQLILGWEIMGLCSFMLIGHWWEDGANSRAALKAFFTTRTGDVGLLVGTSVLYFAANDWTQETLGVSGFSIRGLSAWALSGDPSSAAITVGAVALFIAAIGKSGQFPLHTWLPDAMAGPTPVSSLLHSSTMVVAGVFLVARVYPVFWEGLNITGSGLNFIVIIGGITIVAAALLAFVQTDIKKVLAYSTVSQLGFMFLAVGSGAYVAAIFHMVTHAFFKALLFLGSGSVIHGMHHEQDMRRMGALRKFMPITAGTFIIGWLAIAGIPPFAGFWSKDEILLSVWAYPTNSGLYKVLWGVALVTALLTAFYMTRQVIMVFFGKARWNDHAEDHGAHGDFKPHESPAIMLLPLVVLCGLSIVGGGLNLPFTDSTKRLLHWLEPIVHFGEVHPHETAAMKWALAIGTAVLCAASIGIAFAVYQR